LNASLLQETRAKEGCARFGYEWETHQNHKKRCARKGVGGKIRDKRGPKRKNHEKKGLSTKRKSTRQRKKRGRKKYQRKAGPSYWKKWKTPGEKEESKTRKSCRKKKRGEKP